MIATAIHYGLIMAHKNVSASCNSTGWHTHTMLGPIAINATARNEHCVLMFILNSIDSPNSVH